MRSSRQAANAGEACRWSRGAEAAGRRAGLHALLALGLGDTRSGVIARTTRHMDPLYGAQKVAKTKLAYNNCRLDVDVHLSYICRPVALRSRVVALCIVDPRPKGCASHRAARPAACLWTGSRLRLSDAGDSGSATSVTVRIPTHGGPVLRRPQARSAETSGTSETPRTADGSACTAVPRIESPRSAGRGARCRGRSPRRWPRPGSSSRRESRRTSRCPAPSPTPAACSCRAARRRPRHGRAP